MTLDHALSERSHRPPHVVHVVRKNSGEPDM